jgi:hypothetical protein
MFDHLAQAFTRLARERDEYVFSNPRRRPYALALPASRVIWARRRPTADATGDDVVGVVGAADAGHAGTRDKRREPRFTQRTAAQ